MRTKKKKIACVIRQAKTEKLVIMISECLLQLALLPKVEVRYNVCPLSLITNNLKMYKSKTIETLF